MTSQDINYVAQANETVKELAAKVREKSIQMERLEHTYNSKIRALDEYFKELQKNYPLSMETQNNDNLPSLEDMIPPKCKHCSEIIELDNYILIPKRYEAEVRDPPPSSPLVSPSQPVHSTLSKPPKKNKKLSCSFCKNQGHSRRDCPIKLGQQIS